MPPHVTTILIALVATAPVASRAGADSRSTTTVALDVHAFRPVEGPRSGPAVYYRIVEGLEGALLQGTYRPGMQSVTMGIELPDDVRKRALQVRWTWRARAVPERGDECRADQGDSAASVSLVFKRGMRWYVLKYVWSGASPSGAVCDRKRSMLLARDTIVLERGPARETWLREVVDVRRAFVDHFADGDPEADVPDLVGIGVMTDGDQTHSEAAAEWARFEVTYSRPEELLTRSSAR